MDLMDFPKKLATEEATRRVITALETDLLTPGWSEESRLFTEKLLAGHRKYLTEFEAVRAAAMGMVG